MDLHRFGNRASSPSHQVVHGPGRRALAAGYCTGSDG
jgi:hypothetical protein